MMLIGFRLGARSHQETHFYCGEMALVRNILQPSLSCGHDQSPSRFTVFEGKPVYEFPWQSVVLSQGKDHILRLCVYLVVVIGAPK